MIRTFLIPLLAIAGVVMAVITVVQGSRPPIPQPPVVEPPRAPYESFVAGSGLVEASTQNIAVGTPVPGVCAEMSVTVGQSIKTGDTLFRIDSRELEAQLVAHEASLRVAEAQLAKMRAGTRPEELPAARARVAEMESMVADMQSQYDIYQKITDQRARSEDELNKRRFAVETMKTRLSQSKASLALLEAGTWSADIAIAEAQVTGARAQVQTTKTEIDRRIVRSSIDGRVLQVNLRVGEFAQASLLSTPLMVIGAVNPLHVRVDVDEHDAWRVKQGSPATAFVRGNKDLNSPLTFVRFEPYIVPKKSLTGESTERVDTRVLQVIYAFDPKSLPIYVGQQMDVYIQGEPLHSRATPPPPATSSPEAPSTK